MEYPDQFIRGILYNSDEFYSDGMLMPAVFKKFDVANSEGLRELSINWYDDEGAITQLIGQRHKTEDRPLYLGGVAIVDKYRLDEIKKHQGLVDRLFYERAPLDENKYHGNILFFEKKNCDNKTRLAMFSQHLASFARKMELNELIQC